MCCALTVTDQTDREQKVEFKKILQDQINNIQRHDIFDYFRDMNAQTPKGARAACTNKVRETEIKTENNVLIYTIK